MKLSSLFLLCVLSATTAHASWFGSDDDPSHNHDHDPVQWSQDQFQKAQAVFSNIKQDAFDSWDESRLREFLLDQGVVAPSGTREQLALLAKQKYRQYSIYASSYSATATSLASQASNSASTAVYGDSKYQASKSVSSLIAQATNDVSRKLDDSKDYAYSTWDDNTLRTYLENKGVIKTKQQATRDELLAKMRQAYLNTTDPVWKAWSDSYIHEWLVSHGILKSDVQKTRDQLQVDMTNYYYDTKDYAWSFWSDSDTRAWLISHNLIKSDAQIQREKLQKLIADNYANAKDTLWGAWADSDMTSWLVEHGYLPEGGKVAKSREELVGLMNEKYNDYSARTAPYLVWPDARLRAYLRESGISEDALPTSRLGLLQEVRIRYVQTTHRADAFLTKVREVLNSGVYAAEEKIGNILDILTGHAESAKTKGYAAYDVAQSSVQSATASGKSSASTASNSAQSAASSASKSARSAAGEASKKGGSIVDNAKKSGKSAAGEASKSTDTAKQSGESVVGEAAKSTEGAKAFAEDYESKGKAYWNEKVEEAKRAADQVKVEL